MTQAVQPKPTVVSTVVAERPATALACMSALGIVYGDLGTSPLYTYQTIVAAAGGHPSAADALGLLSLVVWALIVTVSVKYCVFVMRADNHGEGGILALMALVTSRAKGRHAVLLAMGLFGAALIYGDGIITPAISVLSALEGINVATATFKPYVLPAALVVLFLLFAAQRAGTARIGRVFGPIMLLWFVTIAALGLLGVLHQPRVILAIDPREAIRFLALHRWHSFVVLGGVFLAITGGEALYADIGHVGRNPIRTSWYGIVLPALLLSYAGQTARLISDPGLTGNPFFRLAPGWAVIPLVVLATLATIIASQSIITGAFSLTRQAIQLGWFPGLRIRQTSDAEYGQIYVPVVNWAMMLATLLLTAAFGSSDRLAGAYGTAVSTTMLLTTGLLYNAMRDVWGWSRAPALAASAVFLFIDLIFFAANLLKIGDGGWVPLLIGALIFAIMLTWHRGMAAIRARLAVDEETPAQFTARLARDRIARVPGTAVFLSRTGNTIPPLLVCHIAQIRALQEKLVSLTVVFEPTPRVAPRLRAEVAREGENFWHVTVRFGFVEMPNLAIALEAASARGCDIDLHDVVYFAAHDEVVRSPTHPMLPGWQLLVFGFLFRNALRGPDRFDLPADRFVEIGRQVEL